MVLFVFISAWRVVYANKKLLIKTPFHFGQRLHLLSTIISDEPHNQPATFQPSWVGVPPLVREAGGGTLQVQLIGLITRKLNSRSGSFRLTLSDDGNMDAVDSAI